MYTDKVWFDASCISEKNGISRDGNLMISRMSELGTVEILDWPKFPFMKPNTTRKVFNLLLLISSWSPRIPKRFKGYFYQQQFGPYRARMDNVWIIRTHDIFPVTNPEWFYWWTSRSFAKSLGFAIRETATFRCVSEHTRSQLLKIYPDVEKYTLVDPCEVTPLIKDLCGACLGCSKIEEVELGPFVIAVGTVEPRKNYSQIIRLAESLPKYRFVLIGSKGWKSKPERKRLNAGLKNLYWISSCCDGALNEFYTRATIFISTSLDEGFNLPALEARELYKLPLIISDIPVHRELHTGYAKFFTSDQEAKDLLENILRI